MPRPKHFTGFALILTGLLTSRIVLETFVSPYAIVELNYRIPIIFINIVFIVLGFLILFIKKEYLSLEKISKVYKSVAVNLFGISLFLLVLKFLLYGFLILKDIGFYKDQIFFSYSKPLKEIYPNLHGKELNLLLYETWSRPYIYAPFTQFKERPFMGKYVNVHSAGFRLTKNQGPWPPDSKNLNIFIFGGSAVFGYGIKDDETIASVLQDLLSLKNVSEQKLNVQNYKKPSVYNFATGNYFSSQEKILFQELLLNKYNPDIVIFIDGLNDFYYTENEPAFTQKLRRCLDYKGKNLLAGLFPQGIRGAGDVHAFEELSEKRFNNTELLHSVIKRYVENKAQIEAIASLYKIKTVFVWQPVPTYKYDLHYHIFSGRGFGQFLYSKYGYALMHDYVKEHNLGKNFLWLADIQDGVKKSLYVDIDHYSAEFSEEIAKQIHNFLVLNKLV